MKRKIISYLIITGLIFTLTGCGNNATVSQPASSDTNATSEDSSDEEKAPTMKELEKSAYTNPIAGNSTNGEYLYGGDPSALVDGDTVYIYTGHDVSTDHEVETAVYNIPEYLCYSSTDMINWTPEGSVMTMDTVAWANDDVAAWASQVAKHYDSEADAYKYYLYYCTWAKGGKQAIGVAVADSPKGPFVDIGEPLVHASKTKPQTSNWNDIDPTVWIDTDENGEEHIYLAWGNGIFYICELNSDMVSVKDMNGDGEITSGKSFEEADIIQNIKSFDEYTEAPWLYRRSDADGNYYGDYYLFYAKSWREGWAYSTTDDLSSGQWKFGDVLMPPNATSNTNHMGIFDFKGKTYCVYHNGSLPGGNGYRRSACVMEISFDENGAVNKFTETTAGIAGTTVDITTKDGKPVGHENHINSYVDSDYPIKLSIGEGISDDDLDNKWVLCVGKSDPENANAVSIQSENKTGLYLTVDGESIILTQDTDASEDTAKKQTFISYEGLDGNADTVSFESVLTPGQYITVGSDGKLVLTDGSDVDKCSFTIK